MADKLHSGAVVLGGGEAGGGAGSAQRSSGGREEELRSQRSREEAHPSSGRALLSTLSPRGDERCGGGNLGAGGDLRASLAHGRDRRSSGEGGVGTGAGALDAPANTRLSQPLPQPSTSPGAAGASSARGLTDRLRAVAGREVGSRLGVRPPAAEGKESTSRQSLEAGAASSGRGLADRLGPVPGRDGIDAGRGGGDDLDRFLTGTRGHVHAGGREAGVSAEVIGGRLGVAPPRRVLQPLVPRHLTLDLKNCTDVRGLCSLALHVEEFDR